MVLKNLQEFKYRWENIVIVNCNSCPSTVEIFESELESEEDFLCAECGRYELPLYDTSYLGSIWDDDFNQKTKWKRK